jgi:predicted RNase H-like nuclease (RuvC/YqgF family)
MPKSKTKMDLTIVIALIIAFSGCSHMMNPGKTIEDSASQPVANDKYATKIRELNQIIQNNSKSTEAKNAHLKLARLYSDHKNQSPNYHRALDHLRAYMNMEESPVDGEMLNWMASLKEIDRLSKEITAQHHQINTLKDQLEKSKKAKLALSRTNHKLTREEINLREKNRNLEESNQNLKKTIEMLKDLDERLEEKRKIFSN